MGQQFVKYIVLVLVVAVTLILIDSKILTNNEKKNENVNNFELDQLIQNNKLNTARIQDNIDRVFQKQNEIIQALQHTENKKDATDPVDDSVASPNIIDNETPIKQEEETLKSARAKLWNERKNNLDWDALSAQVKQRVLPNDLASEILHELSPVIELPPIIPPRVTTRPQQFELPLPPQCSDGILHPKFITGEQRMKAKKVVDVFQFGYEYDVLEVRLNELNDVVDLFVIGEATCSHRLAEKKLFLASQIDERFYKFRHKIFLVVLDDAICDKMDNIATDKSNPDDWRLERFSRGEVWGRFRNSAIYENYSDALFLFGDCDEIPRSELVHQFKYCEMTSNEPVGIGGLFYRNNFEFIEPKNSNVQTTFPYPIITSGAVIDKDIKALRTPPKVNMRVENALGGFHLNRFGSNYLRLFKQLAIAEGGSVPRKNLEFIEDPEGLQQFIDIGARECCDQPRSSHVAGGDKRLEFMKHNIPWFALCNHDRFPDLVPENMPLPASWEDIDAYCMSH